MKFLIYRLHLTQHEKTKLICIMHILHPLHYSAYSSFCVRYTSSVNYTQFIIVFYMSSKSLIDKLRHNVMTL